MQVVQRPLGMRLAGQGRQHGLGAVAQGVMAVVQRVALAGGFINGHFLNEVAHAVVGKAAGVQWFEGEFCPWRLCGLRQQLWF